MAARRGLGITSKDMEASRLVFVFVRDSKPKRKVAIPVPDTYSLDQFLEQVKTKLKLSGIADIYFSSNGQKVRSVSELQDIDELCVVEGPDAAATNGAGGFAGSAAQRPGAELEMAAPSSGNDTVMSPSPGMMRQQSTAQERHKVVITADGVGSQRSGSYDDEGSKYTRRTNPLKRTLQRLFPNLLQPGLPVTARDAQDSNDGNTRHGSRRRRKRSAYDLRNVLLLLATMSCAFTMLYLFIRVSSAPAVGGLPGPGQQAAAAAVGAVADAAAAAAQKAAAVGAAAPGGPDAAGVAGGGVSDSNHAERKAADKILQA